MEKTIEEVLKKLTALGESVAKFASRLDTSDESLVKVGDKIGTVETVTAELREAIKKLEESQKTKATRLLPGIQEEVKENGPLNPVSALLDKNSRDYSIAMEYTNKRRDVRLSMEGDGLTRTTMITSDEESGGVFIPHIALPGYIDKVRERSILWRPPDGGPNLTRLTGLTGFPVEIPTITGDVTVAPASEIEAPTESQPTTGMLKFEPRAIKSLTKLSKRLRRMAPIAAQVVQLSATKMFALEIDRQGLRGSGTDKESLGIVNTPGINSIAIGTNGGDVTLPVFRAMRHKLRQQNVPQGPNTCFVGHPDVFYTAQTERIAQYSGQTDGEYVFRPMTNEQLTAQIGPWFDSTLFPTNLTKGTGTSLTELLYGNWEDHWMGIWEDLLFRVSTETGDSTGSAFTKGEIWILSEMECDFQCAQPLSFVLANDCNTVTL